MDGTPRALSANARFYFIMSCAPGFNRNKLSTSGQIHFQKISALLYQFVISICALRAIFCHARAQTNNETNIPKSPLGWLY